MGVTDTHPQVLPVAHKMTKGICKSCSNLMLIFFTHVYNCITVKAILRPRKTDI